MAVDRADLDGEIDSRYEKVAWRCGRVSFLISRGER